MRGKGFDIRAFPLKDPSDLNELATKSHPLIAVYWVVIITAHGIVKSNTFLRDEGGENKILLRHC